MNLSEVVDDTYVLARHTWMLEYQLTVFRGMLLRAGQNRGQSRSALQGSRGWASLASAARLDPARAVRLRPVRLLARRCPPWRCDRPGQSSDVDGGAGICRDSVTGAGGIPPGSHQSGWDEMGPAAPTTPVAGKLGGRSSIAPRGGDRADAALGIGDCSLGAGRARTSLGTPTVHDAPDPADSPTCGRTVCRLFPPKGTMLHEGDPGPCASRLGSLANLSSVLVRRALGEDGAGGTHRCGHLRMAER